MDEYMYVYKYAAINRIEYGILRVPFLHNLKPCQESISPEMGRKYYVFRLFMQSDYFSYFYRKVGMTDH